jgi:membrane carboxypeptidase/penicillin-binding protein
MSTLTLLRRRRQRRDQVRRSARQRSQRLALAVGFTLSALAVVLILGLALGYASLTRGLPPVDELTILLDPQAGQLLQPTRLYDRTGQHLIAVLAPIDYPRVFIPYEALPLALVDATLALNQPDFWTSPGYTASGWQDPASHPTLAQALVYELLLWDRPASLQRAIQERMLAAQVTARFGRQRVLEWVLNSADYGNQAFGIEAAAELYLGKSANQLTLSESALLAAVRTAPDLNPFEAPLAAEALRVETLHLMQGQGLLSAEQAEAAIAAPPVIAKPGTGQLNLAPAFIDLVLSQLETRFGAGRIERGGMVIVTSLDYDLQLQSECSLQTYLRRLAGDFNEVLAADGSPCQAARLLPALGSGETRPEAVASALLLDPQTGQVLAAVGDSTAGATGPRLLPHPAGTSLTPFIYLTGFTRGLNPGSLGWDIPPGPSAGGTGLGQLYHGPVRLRIALVNDYLAPARLVLQQMGQESVAAVASPFGLDFPVSVRLLQDDFDLEPLKLAGAYGILADEGTRAGQALAGTQVTPVSVLQVSGLDHSLWADWSAPQKSLIVSPQLAYLMNHVLSDEAARWPSLGHPNSLEIGRPAGVKLSHSLDGAGAWTIGYTPQRVVLVHLGASGAGSDPAVLSADLWHALAQYATHDLPPAGWAMPPGLVMVPVCDPSGQLPTQACPNVVNEVFLEGRQPAQSDNLYQSFQINQETGLLATVFTPPELVEKKVYLVVPPEARPWAQAAGLPQPPTAYDTVQLPPASTFVHITTPAQFADGRGVLTIRGSAAGADFASYRLEYGQGLYPQAWLQIGRDSTTPVVESTLGSWDTTGLDGLYALRLMVVRTDRSVEQAVVQVTLDNTPPQVAISYPSQSQEIRLAEEPQVLLQAQVDDPFLTGVEFFLDDRSLGKLETGPFGMVWQAAAGSHTLRVVATDRAGNTAEASLTFQVK